MQDFILSHYNWFKALHLIAVISWMAGLFYLPRLFVYHADAEKGSELSETLKIMERKLMRIIMNPAMVLTWLFGLALIYANHTIAMQGWFHGKFLAVILMTGFHHFLSSSRKKFVQDKNARTAKFYRQINEIPTILMIIIVILVIVQPF